MSLSKNNQKIIFSLNELDRITNIIISKLKPGMIIALKGPMGSGKTTLSRNLLIALGVKDAISSPTYSYLNRYKVKFKKKYIYINHLDLYRVNEESIEELGLLDYIFNDNEIVIIEWPDILKLSNKDKIIFVELNYIDNDKRKIIIDTYE